VTTDQRSRLLRWFRLAQVAGRAAGDHRDRDPVAVGRLQREHLDQTDQAADDAGDDEADAEGTEGPLRQPGTLRCTLSPAVNATIAMSAMR